MKQLLPCLLLSCLLTTGTYAQQHNLTPADSLQWVTGKLGTMVYYIKQARYLPVSVLDSLHADADSLPGVITRNWLQCHSNDSRKLDAILALTSKTEQRKALLQWKYTGSRFELEGLLECCSEVQRACFTLFHQMKGDDLFGSKPEYDAMATTAEDNFMLYQHRLHGVLDTHHNNIPPTVK
ncbi:hypothetical protein HNQ91_003637 [Filimonas zeae]|uniref:Uncharacterized protein n=1 Tax=Filimonas zeae TaxID=1737353 RepID=A0A917J0M7_9BACT|nr:hypothetical protein [Filimonas zeae]MDR6340572.1 hypothetical protein [Filimonas zeae]GGH73359.1 hypothetical protein GCM10011379_34790 [Filimonas zeae]